MYDNLADKIMETTAAVLSVAIGIICFALCGAIVAMLFI